MTRCVIVLPSIVPEYTEACLATLSPDIIDVASIPRSPTRPQREPLVVQVNGTQWHDGAPDVSLIVAYNTPEHNLGVSASWNLGVDAAIARQADWLVILSAGVRFGPAGGKDFLNWLHDFSTIPGPEVLGVEGGNGLGWHLLAFPLHVLERVGRFDDWAFPSYFEDNDYSVRIQRAYDRDTHAPGFTGPLWPKVEVDAHLESVAHGITMGGVTVDFEELRRRFIAKWGPNEEYRTPYNDPLLDWTWWGPHEKAQV